MRQTAGVFAEGRNVESIGQRTIEPLLVSAVVPCFPPNRAFRARGLGSVEKAATRNYLKLRRRFDGCCTPVRIGRPSIQSARAQGFMEISPPMYPLLVLHARARSRAGEGGENHARK
jgi:hypothetical protein